MTKRWIKSQSMKRHHTILLSEELLGRFRGLPQTRSAAICQAISNAEKQPELLADAFKLRLSMPFKENEIKVAYTRDEKVDGAIEKLERMTGLKGEPVIRLAMEAFIYRL